MATWKKVIVSGSDISQLNNDANYLVEGGSGASLSGSFSGSFQGDGSGLSGVVATAGNPLTDGNGIADFSYDGSTAGVTVAVQADGSTLTVGANGVKVSDVGITSTQLANDAVTSGKIADAAFAVTASGDVSGQAAIVSDEVQITLSLGAGVVDTAELADGAVVSASIAADAVGADHIADGSISIAMMSASAIVTEAEGIAANDVDTAVPTAAAVKDYVDTQLSAEDLDFAGDSGTGAIDLDSQTLSVVGGAGLQTTASNQTLTVNIVDGGVTNDMLANSSITIGDQSTALGGTVTSFSGSFQGDGSGLTGVSAQVEESLLLGDGLSGGTFDGSVGVTASINLDGATLAVSSTGLKIADGGVDTTQLATGAVTDAKIASGSIENNKLANSSWTVSDGSNSTAIALGDTFTINGTANEVSVVEGSGTVTVGLPDDITIGQDLTVSRNLIVQGTASFQHTEDLAIADRFILLASGSSSAGDGGIVVQQTAQDVGEVFAFDSANTRWGISGSFDASQNAFVPDAFMAAVSTGNFSSDSAIQAGIDSRYSAKGNIFIGDDQGIWIYS